VACCPAAAGRARFDIGDIVRQHRAALEAVQHLSVAQRRVLSAIALCRTAALGGHIDVCRSCGLELAYFNSCRNRHCPKCQALAQEQWIAARAEQLLPVEHFHAVFTLPAPLRPLCRYRPAKLYAALFAAASETLLELGTTCLKARLGVTMVLHTWSRQLLLHPHVHAIVTAGGLALDGSHFKPSSRKYLLPVKQILGVVFRGKMMAALHALHGAGRFNGFDEFADPEGFDRLMSRLAARSWVVYVKKPFRQVGHVVQYLGRYTHRVAISNSRLLDVTDQAVTFRSRDRDCVTVPPVEFLRRFVQHVLPDGFHKIRHYGLYSATAARPEGALGRARSLLPAAVTITPPAAAIDRTAASSAEQLRELTGRDVTRCPRCGNPLERLGVPAPRSRAPPHELAP
jgi:predicted RNA-binding Zn-ribbon protein involved in translation (DUF1610 family)